MSTYANGGDPRRQPHQQPMTAASTGYIPYGQHVNYGQHSHTVPYGSNGYPPPAPGSAGSAVNGSTGIGGQPMPGVQHGYSLQQQQQQQQQLYAMQQIHYAQMMAQQQHHQPPPSMVFNAQVHVPVPVGYPQYSLPPHLQSQQQYARPVAPSAPMTQAPSPTQRVLSPSSSAASSNSSRQPQPQPHQHLRPPPSQTVASKLASRRSPSVQSMAASARARDDDDNASIASTSSSKSFSGFITGVKRGFMKGIGLRSESQRESLQPKRASASASNFSDADSRRGSRDSVDTKGPGRYQPQYQYGKGLYSSDQPPPPPPQPLQPQMRFPGPPPPGSYPYGQMPPPPGTIPGMPPMNMFPALPSGFHQPDFSQPPPGVINVNGQLQYPGPPPPGLLPPPSMLQQPPVILRASAALTHESSVMPAITPTSKDEAAPVFTSSLHKLDPRFSFDDSDDQIEVQVQDSPTPPLNEYEESRCSSTTTVVLLDSKLVDEPDAENNAPRSVHTEEALAEDTRTEDPPGEHPSIDVTISKGPTKEVPWKATRKAVSSTTLPRKLSDKGPSTKTRTKSHDDDYALGSIPATAFSTKSLDRSLGRHKRSNSGSGNVLVEDVMMQHRDVSHLFWAVDRDVGAPDLHPVKLFADVAQMAASDATVVEEAAIAVGHASLSRKKSLLGKVVAAESAASDMPTLPVAAAAEESDDSFVVLNPEMLGNLGGSLSRTRSFKQSHVVITADGVTDVASGEKMPTSPETTPPIAEALPIAMIGKAEEAAEKDGIPKGGDSAQPFANFYDYTVPPEKLQINNGTVLAEPTLPVVEMPADTEGGDDASMREKWNWISGKIPERSSSKGKVAPHPTLVDDVITADGKFLEPPTEQSLGHRSSLSDDEFAYPDQNDPHFNGFPRYPLHIEKSIYQLSHAKLAQARRPLIHQVMISNLMLYILSVHADVTIHRQGPRKNRNKKKKKGGKKKKRTATKEEADASDSDSGGAVFIHQSGLQQPVNGPLIVLENPNKQQKRRSTSSISSVSSLDSNGSFASESESEIEHAAPAAEGSSGFGLFGGNKKSAKGASAKSGGALNMAMGLYRAMGRNLARKKSQTLIGNGDDDDVPLAVLAGKN